VSLVLVVDDEAPNRELLRVLLAHDGHRVLDAEDGEIALELFLEHRPDLLIVDLYMPGMTGTDLIKHVRRHDETGQTKIALYTGTDTGAALLDFMKMMNVGHVIPKPAEPETIIAAIRSALS